MATSTLSKPASKRQRVIDFLQSQENASTETVGNNVFVTYTKGPCFVVGIVYNRATSVGDHYRFNTEEKRAEYINGKKTYIQKQIDAENARLAEYQIKKEGFVAGAVLVSSWGCEQTNIDFYQIIERKGDFVLIQEIGENRQVDELGDRGKTTPDATKLIGVPFRKKISKFASIELASYKYCSLWDGSPKYWSSYA